MGGKYVQSVKKGMLRLSEDRMLEEKAMRIANQMRNQAWDRGQNVIFGDNFCQISSPRG